MKCCSFRVLTCLTSKGFFHRSSILTIAIRKNVHLLIRGYLHMNCMWQNFKNAYSEIVFTLRNFPGFNFTSILTSGLFCRIFFYWNKRISLRKKNERIHVHTKNQAHKKEVVCSARSYNHSTSFGVSRYAYLWFLIFQDWENYELNSAEKFKN